MATDSTPARRPARRPGGLTAALVVLWFQVVTNLAGGILFLVLASVEAEHGRDGTLVAVGGAVSVLAAPVLAVGAVGLARRRLSARTPVLVVEILVVLNGVVILVVGLLNGLPPSSVIGIILAVLVIQGVFSPQATAWLRGETPAATDRAPDPAS